MRSYTVFLPPYGTEPSSDARNLADAEGMVLVKDGFTWTAALVPLIWLLACRAWLALLGFIAALIALGLLMWMLGLSDTQQAIVLAGIGLVMGFEAHNLRAWSLRRKGWRETGIAVGRNRAAAERDFLRIYKPPRADNDLAHISGQFSL